MVDLVAINKIIVIGRSSRSSRFGSRYSGGSSYRSRGGGFGK